MRSDASKRAIARESWHLLVHPIAAPRVDDLRLLSHERGLTLTQAVDHLHAAAASANSNAEHA